MHPPCIHQALLEDMKMLENEFGLAEMAKPERDDDPNSLNGGPTIHDPNRPSSRTFTALPSTPRPRSPPARPTTLIPPPD